MKLDIFGGTLHIRHQHKEDAPVTITDPHRIEVPLVSPTEEQFKVILLDAEDSFDVIIHYPTGERECLWSMVKE